MISIALVGCGEAARDHLLAYQTMSNVKIKGVYDQDQTRSRLLAQEFGTQSLGFEEVVQQVDLVDICSPMNTHWQMIRQIQNVRGILCEAPLASDMEEAKAIVEYCKEHALSLFPVHRAGFSGPLGKIREFVGEDPPRKKGMIRITRRGQLEPSTPDSSLELFARSEKVFLETLFDDFAFLLKTFGPVARIFASSTTRPRSNEVYALVSLKFTNGTIAHLNANVLNEPSTEDVEFAYPDGLITYSEASASPLRFSYQNHSVLDGGTVYQGAYSLALNHIINAVLSDSEAWYTPDDSLQILATALGAIESDCKRQVLKLGSQGGRSDD